MKRITVTVTWLVILGAVGSAAAQSDAIDPQALVETILSVDNRQREQIQDIVFDAEYIEGETGGDGEFHQKVRIVKKTYIKYLPDTVLLHEEYLEFYKEGELQDAEATEKEAAERKEKKIKRKSKDISWPMLSPFHPDQGAHYDIIYEGVPEDSIEGRTCHHFRVRSKEKDAHRIHGDYYFDAESFQLVRVDFTPAKLTSSIMFKMKQLDMTVRFGPTLDGYWLPRQFDIAGRGKTLFLIGAKFAGTEYYRNPQINTGIDSALFEENHGEH